MQKALLTTLLVFNLALYAQAQIVITELMYNPPGDDTQLEYLELYNAGAMAIQLDNYTMEGVTHTFAASTTVNPGEYLVLAVNADVFTATFGKPAVKWTSGALNNTGEAVRIKNENGDIVDEVTYGVAAPWPTAANGSGASLVLCDPLSDNSKVESWRAASTPTGKFVNNIEILANPGAESKCGAITVKTYPARTIQQMTTENASGVADSVNLNCELEGIVYGGNLRPVGLQFTLMDATGANGIAVFRSTGSFGYTIAQGDRVKIRGSIAQFNGLTQMNLDTVIQVSSGNALAAPTTVKAPNESVESRLMRITNLTLIDPSKWTTGMGSGGFSVKAISSANPLDTVDIRIDNDVDLYNLPAPAQPFNLVGIGGQFDASAPFTSGYQVLPRNQADITTSVGAYETDFSAFVRIAPNPIVHTMQINTSASFDRILIFSASGALVKSIVQPQAIERVAVSHLPAGAYVVRFEKDGAFWAAQVMKQ